MEDDSLNNASSHFGELFEGQTAVFETTFSEADVLVLENGLELATAGINNISSPSVAQPSSPYRTMQIQLGQKQQFRKVDLQTQISNSKINSISLPVGGTVDNSVVRRSPSVQDDEDSLMNETGEERVLHFTKDDIKEKISLTKDLNLVIRHKINKHLKQRGYLETLIPKIVTKEVLSQMVDPSISKTNAVLFGPTYRAEEIHDEIERFYKFFTSLKERNPVMSGELRPMLMPILVFFVRESYINGFKTVCNKLIGDFSRKFLEEDKTHENCLIAIAISIIKSTQGFEDKYLKEVCQKRHKFTLSECTFVTLKKFLSKLKKLKTSKEIVESVHVNDGDNEKIEPSKPSSRIKQVLHRLRGSVTANLPSIKVYTTNGLPSSAAVSQEGSTFAFGMSTSGIRICDESSAKMAPFSSNDENEDADDEDNDDYSVYEPSIKTINGHEGGIYGVSFHPRTKLLYSAGQDSVMRAWDLTHDTNINCKALYRGHFGPIWSVDISPSGQLVGTASTDSTARLWVPERVECVRILAGHYFDVESIKFHPNESYVATGSLDKSARLWSVSDGEMVRIMTGSEGKVSALAFHKSGNYLVGGGFDDIIRVWDIREGELIAELLSPKNCTDLSISGNMLAGSFQDGAIQVWNLRNIVGGCDNNLQEDFVYSVPNPYTIHCPVSSLVGLFYKDAGSLYGLGSHPIEPLDPTVIDELSNSEAPTTTMSLNSTVPNPTSDNNYNSSPMFLKVNPIAGSDTILEISSGSESPSEMGVPTTRLISLNHIIRAPPMSSDDFQNCLDDEDIENTNNTITSSDMEFEVDEQILESFVDNSLS